MQVHSSLSDSVIGLSGVPVLGQRCDGHCRAAGPPSLGWLQAHGRNRSVSVDYPMISARVVLVALFNAVSSDLAARFENLMGKRS